MSIAPVSSDGTIELGASGVLTLRNSGDNLHKYKIKFEYKFSSTTHADSLAGDFGTPSYVTTKYVEQEIEIKTYLTTEYMKQPVINPGMITHSMSPGALARLRPHDKNQFTIIYELKDGLTAPAKISPDPFTGFVASQLDSTSPFNGRVYKLPLGDLVESTDRKFLSADTQSGQMNSFCDDWILSKMGTTEPVTKTFINDIFTDFKADLTVNCFYEPSIAPSFEETPPYELVIFYPNNAQTWTLPKVVEGDLPFAEMQFEIDSTIKPYLTFTQPKLVENTNIVPFNGVFR